MYVKDADSIDSLINPCKYSTSNRAQTYTGSQASSYLPGQEIIFNLPSNTCCDLSESFLDFSVRLLNQTAETPYIGSLTLFPDGVVNAGQFRLAFEGHYSDPIEWNASALQVEQTLEALATIVYRGYTVQVAGTTVDANDIVITISDFNFEAKPFNRLAVVDNGLQDTVGGVVIEAFIVDTQNGILATPRVERKAPFIRQARITVNDVQVCVINSSNVLGAIASFATSMDSRYGQFRLTAEDENGQFEDQLFRVCVELKHINVLRKVFPLNLFGGIQVRIYMLLEDPRYCLIQNNPDESYEVESPRFHYHRLILDQYVKDQINERLDGKGLYIPFLNILTFTDTIPAGPIDKDVLFNPSFSNLLGIIFVMIPQTYRDTPSNKRKLTTWLKNAIGSYRIKLGSNYFPLDQIDSLSSRKDDVEIVEALVQFLDLWMSSDHISKYGRQMFANFSGTDNLGNDPENQIYMPEFNQEVNMSFVAAISCADTPKSSLHCPFTALEGQNINNLSNCVLELKQMTLLQQCTINIFSLSQSFLKFTRTKFEYIQ